MAPDRTTNPVAGGVRTRFVTNGRTVGWLKDFLEFHSKPHAHAQAAAFESRSQNFLAASWTNGLTSHKPQLLTHLKPPNPSASIRLRLPPILQNPLAQFLKCRVALASEVGQWANLGLPTPRMN